MQRRNFLSILINDVIGLCVVPQSPITPWTVSTLPTMVSLGDMDVKSSLAAAMVKEIQMEIDAEIINHLKQIAANQ